MAKTRSSSPKPSRSSSSSILTKSGDVVFHTFSKAVKTSNGNKINVPVEDTKLVKTANKRFGLTADVNGVKLFTFIGKDLADVLQADHHKRAITYK